jgi:hypothetical protein
MEKEILKYLYDNYSEEHTDLTDFIFKMFPSENESVYDHIKYTLDSLTRDNLIFTKQSSYSNLGKDVQKKEIYPHENEFIDFKTFQNRNDKITAKITRLGKKEVEQLRFIDESTLTNKSFRNLNEKVIPNFNSSQKKLTVMTIIVASLSFFAIAFSAYFSSFSVTSKEFLQVDTTLQTNTKILDSMRQVQTKIDSSLRSMVKIDSSKKTKSQSVAPANH